MKRRERDEKAVDKRSPFPFYAHPTHLLLLRLLGISFWDSDTDLQVSSAMRQKNNLKLQRLPLRQRRRVGGKLWNANTGTLARVEQAGWP